MKLGATKCAVLSALIGIQIVATMISCVVPYRHSGAPGPRPHGPQADHLYRGQYGYQITKDAPPGWGHPQSRVPFRYWMEDLMHWSVMTTVPKFQQLLVLQGYMGGDCLIMLKNMPMDTKMKGAQVQLNGIAVHFGPIPYYIVVCRQHHGEWEDEVRWIVCKEWEDFHYEPGETIAAYFNRMHTARWKAFTEAGHEDKIDDLLITIVSQLNISGKLLETCLNKTI